MTSPLVLALAAPLLALHAAPDVQKLVDEEVALLARGPGVRLAVAVVLEPSGKVVAMGGQRGKVVDRELPSTLEVDPGSVMKTFTLGAALEAGLVTPATRVDGEGGTATVLGRPVKDAGGHGSMSLADVMAFSSNVGTAKVYALLGHERLEATLKALELPCPPLADDAAGVGLSYGADIAPTPLQLARAYAAVASGKAFPKATAELVALLKATVDREDGTGKRARVKGVAVAGKTGTASQGEGVVYGDFVGFFPAAAPRYVVLVGVETTAAGYSGGTVAAPAFARLAAKLAR